MKYYPHFLTNSQLEEAGVTQEQIAKLFHYHDKDDVINTETCEFGITIQIWIGHEMDDKFTREFAESFN